MQLLSGSLRGGVVSFLGCCDHGKWLPNGFAGDLVDGKYGSHRFAASWGLLYNFFYVKT